MPLFWCFKYYWCLRIAKFQSSSVYHKHMSIQQKVKSKICINRISLVPRFLYTQVNGTGRREQVIQCIFHLFTNMYLTWLQVQSGNNFITYNFIFLSFLSFYHLYKYETVYIYIHIYIYMNSIYIHEARKRECFRKVLLWSSTTQWEFIRKTFYQGCSDKKRGQKL